MLRTMLTKLETVLIRVKIFLKGGRHIELKESANYKKLKNMGYSIWESYDYTFIVQGSKIVKKFDFGGIELFYSEKTKSVYLKGNNNGNTELYEIDVQLKFLFSVRNTYMVFQIIDSLGCIMCFGYRNYILFSYITNNIIAEGDTECVYYEKIGIFLIKQDDGYYNVYRPNADDLSNLKLEVSNISLQSTIENEVGFQINGDNIIKVHKNGSITQEGTYDGIDPLDKAIAGKYNYIATIEDKSFLLCVTRQKYSRVEIPGDAIESIFEDLLLDRYVQIKDEFKNILSIASIDANKDTITVLASIQNGVTVNIKQTEMDVERSGIFIPITVTTRCEAEETL